VRQFGIYSATIIIISALFSCRNNNYKNLNEGEIYYNIDYIKSQGSLSLDFKPKSLVVSFKSDKFLFEILSPVGKQGIINVVNPEKGIYDTYVNMLGTKLYYEGSAEEIHPGFSAMVGVKIRKTTRKMEICGFECSHAEAVFPFDTNKIYDIWYTDEIKVKDSNISTPFSEIDGVLMSFYYIMGGSELKFEAEAVYKKEIPDKAFERRTKYKLIDKKDMDKIITDMVNL